MRIHSRFRDYYDSIQSFDKDDVIYIRISKELKLKEVIKKNALIDNYIIDQGSKELVKLIMPLGYKEMILGFCGRLYPLMMFYYKEKVDGKILEKEESVVFYDQLELDTFLMDKKIKIPEKDHSAKILRLYENYFSRRIEYLELIRPRLLPLFSDFNVPVFLIKNSAINIDWQDTTYRLSYEVLEINPCLADLSFQKIFDPFSTFQEINMYLGGVLAQPDKPMIEISDNDKVQQHGFDKNSFRTMKGEKKPRKTNRGKS